MQLAQLERVLLVTPLLEGLLQNELDGLDRKASRNGPTSLESVLMVESGNQGSSSGHFYGYSHYLDELQNRHSSQGIWKRDRKN